MERMALMTPSLARLLQSVAIVEGRIGCFGRRRDWEADFLRIGRGVLDRMREMSGLGVRGEE